jgi:hypothetical protein
MPGTHTQEKGQREQIQGQEKEVTTAIFRDLPICFYRTQKEVLGRYGEPNSGGV